MHVPTVLLFHILPVGRNSAYTKEDRMQDTYTDRPGHVHVHTHIHTHAHTHTHIHAHTHTHTQTNTHTHTRVRAHAASYRPNLKP